MIRYYFKTKIIINGQNTDRKENIISIIKISLQIINCESKDMFKIIDFLLFLFILKLSDYI